MPASSVRRAGATAAIASSDAGALLNFAAKHKSAIGAVDRRVDFLPVKLCEQNDRERLFDFFRRLFKEIADAYLQTPFIQSRSVIDTGKGEELHVDLRHRSTRLQLPVNGTKDGFEILLWNEKR